MKNQEWAFERAKAMIEDGDCSAQEIYHGIDCMFYTDMIDNDQYNSLMELFDKKYPGFCMEDY